MSTEQQLKDINNWQKNHQKYDDDNNAQNKYSFKELSMRLDVLESHINSLPTEEKIEEIVGKVFKQALFATGRGTKGVILTGAAIVIALGVITGAFKGLLVFLGISRM